MSDYTDRELWLRVYERHMLFMDKPGTDARKAHEIALALASNAVEKAPARSVKPLGLESSHALEPK